MKRFLSIVLSFCLLLPACACKNSRPVEEKPQTETESAAVSVSEAGPDTVILYTNDVHCSLEDGVGYRGLAEIKAAFTAEGMDPLLIDCGDSIQGGTVGIVSRGEYVIDIMNRVGYDVSAPGNHEFDYGIERFLQLVKQADFPVVCCNFKNAEGEEVLRPYAILENGGKKLAFVGICTPTVLSSASPTNFLNENGDRIYDFCQDATGEKLYRTVQEAVDSARTEGADYVIALSHLGIEEECVPWTSSDVITHTTGIDAVLDGHSHSVIEEERVKNAEGREVLLSSTGSNLASVGCLKICADGSLASKLINDNGFQVFLDDIKENYRELSETVVAHTDVDLAMIDPATGERMTYSNETNLGDLCADAFRAMSGADVAIINGGGIRTDIPAGDITYEQIFNLQPFGNSLCMVESTGEQILDALELSAAYLPGEFGGFLQVSGMSFTIDLSVKSAVETDETGNFIGVRGERRVKDVRIGEDPIDPEKTYTVASYNFILKDCGNGYSMFKDNLFLQDGTMTDSQIIIDFIMDKLKGRVDETYHDIYGQGRINIING